MLIKESLSAPHKTGAIGPKDLEGVVVDTTVQPKAVAHPTDARLLHRAIIKLVGFAKRNRVPLRQSYLRLAKRAAIMTAAIPTPTSSNAPGGSSSSCEHGLAGSSATSAARLMAIRCCKLASARCSQVRSQDQRGPKVYALHALVVECVGKGKARAPYEFDCSIVTPVTSPKGGQFVLHAKPLHGNPFDAHTLGPVIADMEKLTGVEARRIHVDKGYRGHNHPHRFRIWISGQVRRVTASIRREMKRRAAVEPVIGHVKAEHRMDRNYL